MFGVHNREWVLANIKNNHGTLCVLYPHYNYKGEPAGVIEGDSPSFLWLLSANRGINKPDNPIQPSWGGQYENIPGTSHYGGPEYEGPKSSISMWPNDFDTEFAERADWCLDEDVVIEDDKADVWLESECGNIGDLWDIKTDTEASNGKYITIKTGNNSTDSASPDSSGLLTYTFEIEKGGVYNLFARLICPSPNDDSFWIKMDNSSFTMWNGIDAPVWQWHQFGSGFSLAKGTHTLTITYREDGAKLDKLWISNKIADLFDAGSDAHNCTTSLKKVEYNSLIKMYPNPVTEKLIIENGNFPFELTLYNNIGNKLLLICRNIGLEFSC